MKMLIADIVSGCNQGNCTGHYFAVADNYYDLLKGKFEVEVAGGPVYSQHFSGRLFSLPFDQRVEDSIIVRKISVFRNFFYLMKQAGDHTIIFQSSGMTIILAGLLLVRPKTDIYLINYDKQIMQSRIKRMLYKLVKGKIKGVICPDEEIGRSLGLPCCVVPDYIYCGNYQMETLHEKNYDFGIFGRLVEGKGILEAARYFAGKNCTLRIAGNVGPRPEDQAMIEQLREVAGQHSNIVLEEGFLSTEQYEQHILDSRYIVLNYLSAYDLRSSGVIFDALYRGVPVIATRRKLTQFVEDYQVGYVFDDIQHIDLDMLMSEKNREDYISNIGNYLRDQTRYRDKLAEFISGKN